MVSYRFDAVNAGMSFQFWYRKDKIIAVDND